MLTFRDRRAVTLAASVQQNSLLSKVSEGGQTPSKKTPQRHQDGRRRLEDALHSGPGKHFWRSGQIRVEFLCTCQRGRRAARALLKRRRGATAIAGPNWALWFKSLYLGCTCVHSAVAFCAATTPSSFCWGQRPSRKEEEEEDRRPPQHGDCKEEMAGC